MAFDPSGDFDSVADGLEQVTVAGNVTDALRSKPNKKEIASLGYEPTDAVFAVSPTVDAAPKQGDRLVDSDGDGWRIKSVNEVRMGTTVLNYRCLCGAEQ